MVLDWAMAMRLPRGGKKLPGPETVEDPTTEIEDFTSQHWSHISGGGGVVANDPTNLLAMEAPVAPLADDEAVKVTVPPTPKAPFLKPGNAYAFKQYAEGVREAQAMNSVLVHEIRKRIEEQLGITKKGGKS